MSSIHVLSRAVIINEGHILLAYDPRSHPNHYYEPGVLFYYLPGGHVEFKESCQQALAREIEEETGYKGHCDRFLGAIEHSWQLSINEGDCCHTHSINLIFKFDVPQLNPTVQVAQQEEHVAFRWLPLSDLGSVDLRPAILKTLLPGWLEASNHETFGSVMV